ncbi:MAG TPA: hypothetical protein VEM93_03760 [Actinomycetota bacterium]|nr:hypothetical protein [Actinomycetota bacterium]
MASLYVWEGNGATVCRFHRTPSDWDYEPLSAIETLQFVRMLRAEGLARVSPNPASSAMAGDGPKDR